MPSEGPLLDVADLSVSFRDGKRSHLALDRVGFTISPGETVCLVGESGCGKTLTAKSVLRILDTAATIDSGTIAYRDADGDIVNLATLKESDPLLRDIRGGEIGMIYQEPMSALSPMYTIGNQIAEALVWHRKISKRQAKQAAIAALRQVGMPDPEQRVDAYTFELSGGQRQRAMIAMALICDPRLLIADEPTTALDVTTQAVILDLIRDLRARTGMAILFITHDLGVVAEIADRVIIMYLGQVVEEGPVDQVLADPKHPYTRGLIASVPRLGAGRKTSLPAIPGTVPILENRPSGCAFHQRCTAAVVGVCDTVPPPVVSPEGDRSVRCHAYGPDAARFHLPTRPTARAAADAIGTEAGTRSPVLSAAGLTTHFDIRTGFFNRHTGTVKAVTDVSFDLIAGETLGLVGESGCGKTTLGQTLIGLQPATAGAITYRENGADIDLAERSTSAWRPYWNDLRMIFQDPFASLNPRMTAYDIIAEPLRVGRSLSESEVRDRVEGVFTRVGLDRSFLERYPHAFSGGQRQRIGVARALAPDPKVVVADEPVSALDVSVQAQILNLLGQVQADFGLTYLLISHDLAVVAHISDRVAVMYAGRIVELAATDRIYRSPRHPYTEALMSAVLSPDPRARARRKPIRLRGTVPNPADLPTGCAFAPRCRYATDICREQQPPMRSIEDTAVACHHAETLDLEGAPL